MREAGWHTVSLVSEKEGEYQRGFVEAFLTVVDTDEAALSVVSLHHNAATTVSEVMLHEADGIVVCLSAASPTCLEWRSTAAASVSRIPPHGATTPSATTSTRSADTAGSSTSDWDRNDPAAVFLSSDCGCGDGVGGVRGDATSQPTQLHWLPSTAAATATASSVDPVTGFTAR